MKQSKKKKLHVKRKPMVSPTPDKGTHVQRTHKDTLFRFIFRDKKKLLQLYNAINDTSYEDIKGLTITTVENVIYVGYKNDISFLLDWVLSLIEHQSSWNPNIPLRGVLYFSRLYNEFITLRGYSLYSTKQIPLPYPLYIVFYNGEDNQPERQILSLSDAFPDPGHLNGMLKVPSLECRALVININYGKNQELLENCKPLLDYSRFIFYIRENIAAGNSVEQAMDLAVERCLKEDVLTDVLKANRREVIGMFLEEFDEELYYKTLREETLEKGLAEGRARGLAEGRAKGLAEGKAEGLAEGKAEGRADDICELLSDIGEVPQELRTVIMQQRDLDILKKWLKAASKSQSIDEFKSRM